MVVISIISMLGSVVLVSLNGARQKGMNSRIQQETVSLRNQIETSWNGSAYNDLTSDRNAGTIGVALVTSGFGVSADTLRIVSDITGITNTGYGDAVNIVNGCKTYCIDLAYNGTCTGMTNNGLTIFTNNPTSFLTCPGTYLKATKYAIYASYLPNIGYSGYFCIDSTGNTSEKRSGAIPIDPGPGPTCN